MAMRTSPLKTIYTQLLDFLAIVWSRLLEYVRENLSLISGLALLVVMAYGFELFNFNLTIDEEIHSTYSGPLLAWIQQGRWGIYVLNALVMPKTIIPFVPLFVTLVFQMGAILLLLNAWGVKSKSEQFIASALYMTFPIMAYVYTFSTFNYAIGIGLFFTSLGVYIFVNAGPKRLFSILPIAFALSIYQGFLPVILSAFLVYLLIVLKRDQIFLLKDSAVFTLVFLVAYIVYDLVLRILLFLLKLKVDPYIAGQFDLVFFLKHPFGTLSQVLRHLMLPVYFGAKSLYTFNIWVMGILLLISAMSLFLGILKFTHIQKVLGILLAFGILFLPFASGLLMKGQMSMRFLLAVPVAFSGSVLLGMMGRSGSYKLFVSVLAGICVYYFVISNNQLFASSYLALQEDRSFATRLIDAIETARVKAGVQELHYIEVVGDYEHPSLPSMPRIETFGASFFEWGGGDPGRVAAFLQLMGYPALHPLPLQDRARLISLSAEMTIWPADGSVKIVDDLAIVKFGPYSAYQRQDICMVIAQSDPVFCAVP